MAFAHLVEPIMKSIASILFLAGSIAIGSAAADQPNIVFILADDMGWGDIGLNGASLMKTPNIDRIGREGVQLTQFYAGANVCTPSRAALLTGLAVGAVNLARSDGELRETAVDQVSDGAQLAAQRIEA